MKIPSVNISPRVQCGKTAGKTRVSVTQSNSKLHCRDFVRMYRLILQTQGRLEGFSVHSHLLSPKVKSTLDLKCALNPRADIDRWDFHSVGLFTVEIWLE